MKRLQVIPGTNPGSFTLGFRQGRVWVRARGYAASMREDEAYWCLKNSERAFEVPTARLYREFKRKEM